MGRLHSGDVEQVCRYVIETGSTLRETAKHFGVCKSTVHNYCRKCDNTALREGALKVLAFNLSDRGRRGGTARWKEMTLNGNEETNEETNE